MRAIALALVAQGAINSGFRVTVPGPRREPGKSNLRIIVVKNVALQDFGGNDIAPARARGGQVLARLHDRLGFSDKHDDFAQLGAAITSSRKIDQDQPVWADQASRQSIYIVDEGLAYSFTFLPGGKRHIDDIYGPGAICNWTRLKHEDYRCNIMAKAGTTLLALDPTRVAQWLDNRFALANLLEQHELARAFRNSQRIRALISLPAPHKIAMLLLDLQEELALAGMIDEWLPFGLTQQEIGDVAGMTVVHVNRTLAKMVDAGELERRPGKFRLLNPGRLKAQLGYLHYFGRENACQGR